MNKQLKPVNLRLGITDGTNTELLGEELQPGMELVTGVVVEGVIAHLKALGAEVVEDLVTVEEDVYFPLPAELIDARSRSGGDPLPTI